MIGILQTENEFDRAIRDAEFAYKLMEQNREMERFINESIILASGDRNAIMEMVVINEAAAGDKIKGFFEKIKNFFKKIFDKLGASMSALFKEQKDYIEKYKDIITKCKWNVGDGTDIYDYFKGLPRIISVVDTGEDAIIGSNMDKYFKGDQVPDGDTNHYIDLKTFESAQSVKEKLEALKKDPVDPNKKRTEAFNKFTSEGYWAGLEGFSSFKQNDSNGNVSPGDTFKAWFQGSADTITYSGDDMENNFQTCINVCYAGQSYINKLEKIVTTVNKKMDAASKAMEDYHKAQKDKILELAKKEGGNKAALDITITKVSDKEFTANVDPHYLKSEANQKDGKYKGDSIDAVKSAVTNDIDSSRCTIKFIVPQPQKPEDSSKKNLDINITKLNDKEFTANVDPQYLKSEAKQKDGKYKGDSIDAVESAVTNDIDSSKCIIKFIEPQKPEDSSKKNEGGNNPDGNNPTESVMNIYLNYKNYFNEDYGKGSSSSGSSTGTNLTGAGATQVNNAGTTNTNLNNNLQANNMKVNDNITVQGGIAKEAEECLNLDIKNREATINADIMISTTIASSMFNAFKYINKECFNAIKAHVQWYLNNPGADKDSANQTSRTRGLDMNAGGVSVSSSNEKTTTTTETPKTQ